MLKPIKTFFNYLQKNANTSNIFRLSHDLNMSDEIGTVPLEGENGAFQDPLTDPLALDDDDDDNDYVRQMDPGVAQNIKNNGVEYGDDDSVNNIQTIVLDTETSSIDNFIFVDIEKLKNKINKNCSSGSSSNSSDTKLEAKKKNHVRSDINGNSKHTIKNDDCQTMKKTSNIVIENIQANAIDQSTGDTSVRDNDDSRRNQNNKNGHSETENNHHVVGTGSHFMLNASSEAETDEVTDTSSVLLEEIRSDGSDSGLGLDTLRNISVIEKSLASMTPSKSSLKRRSVDVLHDDQPKRAKSGSINFGNVIVYYFPRCQGFSCVPTQGGSTLGMTAKHAYKKTFTLTEHALEQRRLNRLKMAGSELNPSSSSSDESKSEDEISENSLSEADNEAYGFLQPVTARQRRAILKLAGVRKIDSMEKDECRQLRLSREVCGCACNGYCDPDTCECSLAGIKCQVDRLKPHEFPCGCTRDGCANVNGRIEFNPARVKTHFIHTIMRLELEKRHELSDDLQTSVIQHHSTSKWWSQMRLPATPSASISHQQHSISNGGNGGAYGGVYGAYGQQQQQQYPGGKIPPISTMVSPIIAQESLDLHYAYRDDYTLGAETATASFSNDYYGNYNYTGPSAANSSPSTSAGGSYYPSAYHHLSTHHHLSYSSSSSSGSGGSSSGLSNCQYSNYTPTTGASCSGYRMDDMNEINGYFTPTSSSASSSSSAVHNGAATSRVASYQSVIAMTSHNQTDDASQAPQSGNNYSPTPTNSSRAASSISQTATNETNENLSEIIKKSIVESVTA